MIHFAQEWISRSASWTRPRRTPSPRGRKTTHLPDLHPRLSVRSNSAGSNTRRWGHRCWVFRLWDSRAPTPHRQLTRRTFSHVKLDYRPKHEWPWHKPRRWHTCKWKWRGRGWSRVLSPRWCDAVWKKLVKSSCLLLIIRGI